jgi:glycosyltransferase involved in cell wall biosynthesis
MNAGPGSLHKPAVTVIIPAYNTTPWIRETLDSVMAQTFRDFEVIVVNDGSEDTPQLENLLLPYGERIRYMTQNNQGLASARNTGVLASNGRLIALLDSDDVWEPDYLAVQVGAMNADPTIDVLYCDALLFGDGPHVGCTFMEICPSNGEATFAALVKQECNVMVSAIVRREAIFKAGLFDPAFFRSEDFDLWLRIARFGRISYHRKVLVRYRQRSGSLSSFPLRMALSIIEVFRKTQRTANLSDSEYALVEEQIRRLQAEHDRISGKLAFNEGNVEIAISKLCRANEYLKSRKLGIIVFAMKNMPGLLKRISRMRDNSRQLFHKRETSIR